MPDLTSELQRMADDGARRARPLAADDVIRHGDRRRQRTVMWRSVGGLSMAGIIAAVALAVAAPAGHHAAPQPGGIQLAAWTVVKRADGTVAVTVRELRDPAGLQRRLRTDGVPAAVNFSGGLPRSCRPYPESPALIKSVFTEGHPGRFPVMVIHPAALPAGAGVRIGAPVQRPIHNVAIGLVYASPRCTGS